MEFLDLQQECFRISDDEELQRWNVGFKKPGTATRLALVQGNDKSERFDSIETILSDVNVYDVVQPLAFLGCVDVDRSNFTNPEGQDP